MRVNEKLIANILYELQALFSARTHRSKTKMTQQQPDKKEPLGIVKQITQTKCNSFDEYN